MASLVYPLLTFGPELVYSLRSVEKHGRRVGEVFIVGADTPELKNVVNVPFADKKQRVSINIWEKLVAIAENPQISERFLFLNDDFYITKDFDAESIPMYARPGTLASYKSRVPKTIYQKMLYATHDALQSRGLPIENFATHQPVNLEKTKVLQAYEEFKREIYTPLSISFRCAYGNLHRLPAKRLGTVIIKARNAVPKRWAFASHASIRPEELAAKLDPLYPAKSRYEV